MHFLHTRLKVRDLDRAVAFYCTHLGCKEGRRTVSGRGTQIAFLELPGVGAQLELSFLPWDPDFKLDEDIMHLAFEVEGMESVVAGLRAAGVTITEEPACSSSGTWMAFIEDPDGYEIELLEHP